MVKLIWVILQREITLLNTIYHIIKLDQDIDGESSYDQSGWSTSLSADGNVVAVEL